MCDPRDLCHAPDSALGLPAAAGAGPPRPLQPGPSLQLHHGQDLGDSEQPQHHGDKQVIIRHTAEVQTEERACSTVLPKIFFRKGWLRGG